MDKLFSSKIYINHRFKLIIALDLLTVIFGVVASIFLGKASDPFSMLNEHHIEIIEFVAISLVIYTASFYLFGTNKSLWSYLGVNEIVNICFSVVLGDLVTSILYQYRRNDVYKNALSCFKRKRSG